VKPGIGKAPSSGMDYMYDFPLIDGIDARSPMLFRL
jgi:hypothetical protein